MGRWRLPRVGCPASISSPAESGSKRLTSQQRAVTWSRWGCSTSPPTAAGEPVRSSCSTAGNSPGIRTPPDRPLSLGRNRGAARRRARPGRRRALEGPDGLAGIAALPVSSLALGVRHPHEAPASRPPPPKHPQKPDRDCNATYSRGDFPVGSEYRPRCLGQDPEHQAYRAKHRPEYSRPPHPPEEYSPRRPPRMRGALLSGVPIRHSSNGGGDCCTHADLQQQFERTAQPHPAPHQGSAAARACP